MHSNTKAGFTIFELMIATVVFGSLLAILTATMITMTNQFYKGLNASKTQQVARTISDQIAHTIELTAGDAPQTFPTGSTAGVVCFTGTGQGFHYVLNTPLTGEDTSPRATALTDSCTPKDISTFSGNNDPNEFLAPFMRLSNIIVQPNGSIYNITVTVAYGNNDVLDLTTPTNPKCRLGAGSQFCAVVTVKQTVSKRF